MASLIWVSCSTLASFTKVLHVVMQLGVGLVADLVGLGHLGGKGLLVAGGLGLLRGLGGGHGSHDHAADTGHIVLGVEQLQRDLGAVLVDGVGQRLNVGIWASVASWAWGLRS